MRRLWGVVGEQDGWGKGGYHREMEPHFLDDWVEGPSC